MTAEQESVRLTDAEAAFLLGPNGMPLRESVEAILTAHRKAWQAEALNEVARKWQWGAWANAPRLPDQVQERIATAQYVTDWLLAQTALIKTAHS